MRWGRMEPSLEIANIFAGKISTNFMDHNNVDAHGNPNIRGKIYFSCFGSKLF
jgi:hypothetical protein